MKIGKICQTHPELNGLRTNNHVCQACKKESDRKRRTTEVGKLINQAIAKRYSDSLKDKVFSHYGKICVKCGFDNMDALTIDHINQDGAEHRKTITGNNRSGGRRLYKWLVDNSYPGGFRTLYQNCNTIEYREHLRRIKNGL